MTRNSKTRPDEVLFTKKSMESMFNVMNIAVLCVDHELNIRFINQSAESLLDISANRAINFSISELILNSEELESVLFDAIQIQNPYTQRRAVFKLYDGSSVTVDYTVTPWQYDNWPRLVIELYPLDRFLRIDRDEAFRSHQQVTRQMVRGLAHEIKNPLTPMKLRVQHLERSLSANPAEIQEKLRQFSKTMIDQIDTLSNIATEFSHFAKMPKAQWADVELLDVLKGVVELYSNTPNINLHFLNTTDKQHLMVRADKDQLNRVFNNLVKNAVQALADVTDGQINVVLNEEGERYHIFIQDNGVGISQDQRSKIFVPNFTTKSTGTGLGLAMVKNIIEQSGGEIWFESDPGVSTVFHLLLMKHQSTDERG